MKKLNTFFKFILSNDGSIKKRAIRAAIWVSVAGVIVSSLTFFRSIILARLLSPDVFGLMAICMIIIKGVNTFTKSGIIDALIHRQNSFEEDKGTAFTILVVRGFLLYFIVALAAPFIADFYNEEMLVAMLQVIAIGLIFTGFININTVNKQKELDYRKIAYQEKTVAVIGTIIIVVLAYYLRDVWALIYGFVLTTLLSLIFSYVYIKGKISFSFDKDIAKQLFTFGKFITGTTIVLYIATELDNAVIGKVLNTEQLGYYVLAFTLTNLVVNEIARYAAKIMFPAYSKLQDDLPAIKNAYLRVVNMITLLAVPAAVGIFVLSQQIVLVVYGEKWLPAIAPLQLLTVFTIFRAMASSTGYVFYGLGKPKIEFRIALVRLIVMSAIIYYLVIHYGLFGAAITVLIGMFLHWVLGLFFLNSLIKLKFREYLKSIAQPTLTSLIMGLAIYFLSTVVNGNTIGGLLLLIGSGCAIYGLLNINLLKNLIQRKLT